MRMRFPSACIAAFSLIGCDGAGVDPNDFTANDREPSAPHSTLTAVLTCKVNGTPLAASACFTGDGTSPDGNLKITNGAEVKLYSLADIYSEMNQPSVKIRLSEPFSVQAQTNGDGGYVLRVELRDGDDVVFQDEAAEFGVISVSSSDLG